jgi:hypothetical protein
MYPSVIVDAIRLADGYDDDPNAGHTPVRPAPPVTHLLDPMRSFSHAHP